ncbi:hypothetical protein CapIbe_004827 [Capra ibex]
MGSIRSGILLELKGLLEGNALYEWLISRGILNSRYLKAHIPQDVICSLMDLNQEGEAVSTGVREKSIRSHGLLNPVEPWRLGSEILPKGFF